MQTLGGYQMPSQGRIGGQKGVGTVEPTSQASVKRKRDDTGAAHVTGYLSYIRCTCHRVLQLQRTRYAWHARSQEPSGT